MVTNFSGKKCALELSKYGSVLKYFLWALLMQMGFFLFLSGRYTQVNGTLFCLALLMFLEVFYNASKFVIVSGLVNC